MVRLAQNKRRQVVFIKLSGCLASELEVESLGHLGGEHSQNRLSECLAKADALTAIEGQPATKWALLPLRSQRVWV